MRNWEKESKTFGGSVDVILLYTTCCFRWSFLVWTGELLLTVLSVLKYHIAFRILAVRRLICMQLCLDSLKFLNVFRMLVRCRDQPCTRLFYVMSKYVFYGQLTDRFFTWLCFRCSCFLVQIIINLSNPNQNIETIHYSLLSKKVISFPIN